MVSCDLCRKSVYPSEKKVKCSGPCAKVFHLLCADLNKTFGRALAARVGLYWFCSECRGILVGQKGGASSRPVVTCETVAVSAMELLPVEIWIKVFESLSGYQLRQIRMTCSTWNQIVGSSTSLMNKLILRVPKEIILEQHSEDAELLSSCKNRYLHVVFDQLRIIRVNSWSSIAEKLESLSITKCQITIATLQVMLKPLHNLKTLALKCGPFVDARNCPTKLNFSLPALETLILEEVDQSDLLDVFRQICPRLKVFKLPTGSCTETHPQKVAKLVDAVKGTLQEVEFPLSQRLWLILSSIDELYLKGISFSACNEQSAMKQGNLMNLIQKYPTIEMLNLSSTPLDMTFDLIGKKLPNLKRLQIAPRGRSDPLSATFLHQMLDLTHLDISNDGNRYYSSLALNFTNCRNNSLKFLTLKYLQISKSFSSAFPYISHVNMSNCRVDSWSVLFDPTLLSLQHVTLNSVRVEKPEDQLADYLESLKCLSITDCEIKKPLLVALISLSPKLTELSLSKVAEVDDDVVLKVYKRLKKLRKIAITDCRQTTKLSQEHIEKHRSEIEFSHFSNVFIRNQPTESISRDYESDDYYYYSSD